MKTIFLNKAIFSYVQFIRCIVHECSSKDKKNFSEYREFFRIYRLCKQDKEFMDTVRSVSIGMCDTLVKIYYFDILRVWAFLQLLVESVSKKENFVNFASFTDKEFELLEKSLRRCWFYNPHTYCLEYVYLEDEENEVPFEIKRCNFSSFMERTKENLEETQKRTKAIFAYCKLSWKKIEKFKQEEA